MIEIAVNVGSPGLANRIKTYVSILTTFKQALTVKEADTYIFDSIDLATDEQVRAYPGYDHWRFDFADYERKHCEEYKYIDLLYEKTPEYFINKFKKAFSYLKINQDIVDYVDDFTKDWGPTIGLHIRSWYCDRHRWHDNQLFIDAIDRLDESQKIFLCGDNKDVLKQIEDEFGDRIITHTQDRFNHPHLAESGHNHSTQANVDAMIDLMLLSRCDTIVGTYASTFAEVAWWLGDCKSRVIIPEPPNVEESFKNRIFEKL
jgi:hypothetical protein